MATFNPKTFVKPSDTELKTKLTSLQYSVTQQDATEEPFNNIYNENKADGIYVDIVSGEPLFSSTDKYDSGSGWPSFSKTINENTVVESDDYSKPLIPRVSVASKHAGSHLGHVFANEALSSTGSRYCINSAALRFVPVADLEKEGYAQYLVLKH